MLPWSIFLQKRGGVCLRLPKGNPIYYNLSQNISVQIVHHLGGNSMKRLFLCLLCVAMLCGLVACGNADQPSAGNSQAATSDSSETAEPVVEETPPAAIEPTVPLTMGQQNALESAKSYLSIMPFSHSSLIEQLKYDGYTTEDATFAADSCDADWNEQAAKSAQSYLEVMSFSRQELIDQLMYDGFTQEQAEYGVTAAGY